MSDNQQATAGSEPGVGEPHLGELGVGEPGRSGPIGFLSLIHI